MRNSVKAAVVLAVILPVIAGGCGRNTVARVDGYKIPRSKYYSRLERLPIRQSQTEAGAFVLQQLIEEEMILRLAAEMEVPPTDRQLEERLAEARRQPGFKDTLSQHGFTLETYKEMLRVQQAAFNIQTRGVTVTDDEVKAFYDKNKNNPVYGFITPENRTVAVLLTRNAADAKQAEGLLKQGVQFITVADSLAVNKTLGPAGGIPTVIVERGDERWPDAIVDAIYGTSEGKNTKPISFPNGQYAIFQVVKRNPARVAELTDTRFSIREMLLAEKGRMKNSLEKDLEAYKKKKKIEVGIPRYKDKLFKPGVGRSPIPQM